MRRVAIETLESTHDDVGMLGLDRGPLMAGGTQLVALGLDQTLVRADMQVMAGGAIRLPKRRMLVLRFCLFSDVGVADETRFFGPPVTNQMLRIGSVRGVTSGTEAV
jgi:hypothetical protein